MRLKNNADQFCSPGRSWTVMGILNITPDSFYDGGRHDNSWLERARQLVKDGADILDIGGESTRPGSEPVSRQQELDRVIPVIEGVRKRFDIPVSVDTTKAAVAREAFQAGANILNDVSGGRFDCDLPAEAAAAAAKVVVMHSRRRPADMQVAPSYGDLIADVRQELRDAVQRYRAAGVSSDAIIADPGIGFAKTFRDNLLLLRYLEDLQLPYPVLIGTSRKSFLGGITGKEPDHRLAPSLATVGEAYHRGARWFRVHDVAETVDYLKMIDALNAAE
ncbi:MAG: dihydropteroate synthase [Fibrobacterota bacterium]